MWRVLSLSTDPMSLSYKVKTCANFYFVQWSRTCFRLLLQFLLRQAKRWLPFCCVTDYSDDTYLVTSVQDCEVFRDLVHR